MQLRIKKDQFESRDEDINSSYLKLEFSGKNSSHYSEAVKYVYNFGVYQTQNDKDDERNWQPFNLQTYLSLILLLQFTLLSDCLNALWMVLQINKKKTLLNCLDNTTIDLIMPSLPEDNCPYQLLKKELLKLYGREKRNTLAKTQFLSIKVAKDESIPTFGKRFLRQAQILKATNALTDFDVAIALKQAIVP